MADFRRVLTALTMLVLCAGLASAQAVLTCQATQSVPPDLRGEGLTELMGDIVLSCSVDGIGTVPAGLANFTVFTPNNVPITSRVASGSSGISEALLLVNEPQPGSQSVAPAAASGCTDAVVGDPIASATACTYNAFQGRIAAAPASPSVTFSGIPVLPPATPGARLIYRITNVRVNPRALFVPNDSVDLRVRISISGSTSVNVSASSFVTGVVRDSMVFDGLVDADGEETDGFEFRQCDGVSNNTSEPRVQGYIRFRELFQSAFKPQGDDTQNVPGKIYNTESGLTPSPDTNFSVPTVADWGTRLRAVFSNIPLGTAVYVSCGNINIGTTGPGGAVSAASNSAILLDGEQTDAPDDLCAGGGWSRVVANTKSSGTAIWEVKTANGATVLETFDFGVFFIAAPDPQARPEANVQGKVSGNYAPTPADDEELAVWSRAMDEIIPRFVDAPVSDNLILFTLCQTNLLFPYVLGGVAGFDTGLAITNTSTDPWDTTPQSGTCDLNFYGTSAPASKFTTPSIGLKTTDQGAIWSSNAMTVAPAFVGYIIAQCNFQYAHGFAFVSDIGAHDVAMGYLALILPDVDRIGFRPNNGAASLTSESLNN